MTPTHRATQSAVDAYEESRRLARRPWSVRRARRLTPLGTALLVFLIVLGTGFAGSYEFDTTTAQIEQGDLDR